MLFESAKSVVHFYRPAVASLPQDETVRKRMDLAARHVSILTDGDDLKASPEQ